ncbi:MAG TPA: DUF4157 domain-containing protein [Gaiellaceae bacterium]
MTPPRTHAGARPGRGGARPVSKPHDRHEREAERAAEVVAHGGSVAGWSFSAVPASSPGAVQRQEVVKEKTDEEKKQEALKKAGEAALATPQGQALKEKVLADPLVKTVKDAVTSTPGLIVTGAAAAGGVAALAATGKELPFQPPEIPLDRIRPGLAAQVTYQGPVNAPTFVGLTITYKEQAPKGGAKKADPIAADIARLRAQDELFRRGRTYAPGSKEAEEQRLLDEAVTNYVLRSSTLPGLTIPLAPPPAKKEEEQAPAQPAPASPSAAPPAHADVGPALTAPGRPLDPGTRHSMEARFGYDFSRVRVHDDARAAATAASIDAAAFTVGEDVVFGTGRYDPASDEGRTLLAHELAHVAQQTAGGRRKPPATVSPPVPEETEAGEGAEPAHAGADGRPLPAATRRKLESQFGEPLGGVRVHTGPEGRRTAGRHSAIAVARGSDVFFASGAWAPGTDLGDRILRHEVAHLLQARMTGSRPWSEPALEAEAELAGAAPGRVPIRGHAHSDRPLAMKTFVSTVGGSAYLEAAVKFYALWENETATRIGSYQDIVGDLATGTSALSQFRIVAHGNAYNLFLPLLEKGKDYAGLSALGLQTQRQLAVELGNRAHVTSDETGRVFGWLAASKEAKPLLARLGLASAPAGMLKEFLWWVVDEHYAANAKEAAAGSGTPSSAADRKSLTDKVNEAQEATKNLAAAGLPAKATKSDLDELRTRTLDAFAKAGWVWDVPRGDLKARLARFDQPDAAALLREVKAGTFEKTLQSVKGRVSDKTYIEIRGCNIGQNDAYLNGIREFFGTKPDKLPSISAPMLYQFFGTPGVQVLPEGGKKTPPVERSLKFLFEETFDDTSTAKEVQAAVRKARLASVGGLADVLRYANIRAEFEKWWQLKQAKAGAKAPIAAATLKDFQDFLTTAPPRTFPVNAPGIASESLFFLILIPSSAIPALLAWVRDQGYSLPGGEDLAKRFFGGSTKLDPKTFSKGLSKLFVDWLGDDYPVPKNIYFPEDPEYKKNFRRLP